MDIFGAFIPFLFVIITIVAKTFSDKEKISKEEIHKKINTTIEKQRKTIKSYTDQAFDSINNSTKKTEVKKEVKLENKKIVEKVEKKVNKPKKVETPIMATSIIENSEIKREEIKDNIGLEFNKKDIVKGIVMAEILSPPKALRNKNNR